MKKKRIGLILGACLAAAAFAGCGTQDEGGVPVNQESRQDTAAVQQSQNTGSQDTGVQTGGSQQTAVQQNQNGQQGGENQNTGSQNIGSQQAVISGEEAKNAALARAGIGEGDTIGITVELDYDDGIQIYEVDLYTPEKDYEYEIQALDGSILEEEIELTDQVSAIQSQTAITPEAAVSTILGKVQGAEAKNVRMKLEFDDGHWTYEGEVIYNNTSYEYEMDAESGVIYEWSQESL